MCCFVVIANFLHPLPAWNRRCSQVSQKCTSEKQYTEALQANLPRVAGFEPVQSAKLHWVRPSSLCGAAVSANGHIQVWGLVEIVTQSKIANNVNKCMQLHLSLHILLRAKCHVTYLVKLWYVM